MRDLSKVAIGIACSLAFAPLASANDEGIDTEKDTLVVPGGRVVKFVRLSQHETRMSLEIAYKGRQRVLWSRVYEQEYDSLWDQAFFVPLRPGRYIEDLDRDGTPEIGVATWDGGNYLFGYGLVFSVRRESLAYFGRSHTMIDLVSPTSILARHGKARLRVARFR